MSGCQIKRILQFSIAIKYQKIQLFDQANIDITNTCEYSWSVDGVCWTNWTTYKNYLKSCKHIESDFYLKIHLFSSLDRVYLNDSLTTCYNVCLDSSNPFITDFCGTPNLFQPYNNLDCALQLQQQMADSIVCMFGIPIYYFKTEPQQESADYTFKEFSLHNVVDIKQLKLMIQDGTMPSSNPKLTDFDFDWETDWEVELSKSQFAKAFGDNAFPNSRDFIYIPLMKRMWEVNSAYDEKNEGLLWRPTTWKLALVKYNDSTNVISSGFDNLIDGWIINTYDNTFGEREKNEQERLSGSLQVESPRFAANNLYKIFSSDAVRKEYTKDDITIRQGQIYHRGAIIARNAYLFNTTNGCVTYQKGCCGNSGSISFLLFTNQPGETIESRPILEFGRIVVNLSYNKNTQKFNLEFGNLNKELAVDGTYTVFLRWNKKNFTTELNIYPYTHRDDVPVYSLKPTMYWFDYEHPVCELTGPYNNDYESATPQPCQIMGWPVEMTNIKYYNEYLDTVTMIKESAKYTTQHEACVINDLARPIDDGLGYVVK